MSKGNMLLGHARGKVGDLVFSRVNGQQVTRARAAVVKNPQTEAQMIQRILLNTVIQAYSRMSEICDHSFEGVPVGQQSMSVFMRRNLSMLRQHISNEVDIEGHLFDEIYSFSPIGSNEFTINPFVLSSGSLPVVNLTEVDVFSGASFSVTAAGATLTYNDVITSLGLNRGDQLTFISQQAWTDRRAAFNYARVILDPRDSNGNALPLDTAFLDGAAINMPNPRNEGVQLQYSYANGSFTFQMSDRSQWGAAVIVSRQKSDGAWLRSNASLVLDPNFQTVTYARSLQECLDLFAAGSIDVENPMYLNNARRVTAASIATPSAPSLAEGYLGETEVQLGGSYPLAGQNVDVSLNFINLVPGRRYSVSAGPSGVGSFEVANEQGELQLYVSGYTVPSGEKVWALKSSSPSETVIENILTTTTA